MREEWRVVPQFADLEVSNLGFLRRPSTGVKLSVSADGKGGLKVGLRRDGRVHSRSVARIVAFAFLEPPPDDTYVVAYKDENPMNVRAENLLWVPRWFAQEWASQAQRTTPMRDQAIRMESTGKIYNNALECAKEIRGIERYIMLCALDSKKTYMGSAFTYVL